MANVKETLTVVIPVYNEEEVIETVLSDWHSTLTSMGIDFQIKCYNDGSKDDTWAVLRPLGDSLARLNVYDKQNSGHGPTILKGYRDSFDSTWIFQVDSDDEIPASEFPKVWEERALYDLILGRRIKSKTPLPRKIISFISRTVVGILYGANVSDVNTPFRLMRVGALSEYIDKIPATTFAPNLLVTGLSSLKGLRYLEVPVHYRIRQTGTISIQKFKLLKVSCRALIETVQFRFKGLH